MGKNSVERKKHLPLNKEDLSFAKELYKLDNIDSIKDDIPILVECLQDYNWEQADIICKCLLKFPLEIYKVQIDNILHSNDSMWKYWILLRLIEPKIKKTDQWLIPTINKIALQPNRNDKEAEVDENAQEIIEKIKK